MMWSIMIIIQKIIKPVLDVEAPIANRMSAIMRMMPQTKPPAPPMAAKPPKKKRFKIKSMIAHAMTPVLRLEQPQQHR